MCSSHVSSSSKKRNIKRSDRIKVVKSKNWAIDVARFNGVKSILNLKLRDMFSRGKKIKRDFQKTLDWLMEIKRSDVMKLRVCLQQLGAGATTLNAFAKIGVVSMTFFFYIFSTHNDNLKLFFITGFSALKKYNLRTNNFMSCLGWLSHLMCVEKRNSGKFVAKWKNRTSSKSIDSPANYIKS